MYKGFNLKMSEIDSKNLESRVDANHKNSSDSIVESVKLRSSISLVDNNGEIDASKLANDWFPIKDYDIFLSHSHADQKLAEQLSDWFQDQMGLRVFVDSQVWGSADTLLKELDDRYCVSKTDSDGTKTYDYQMRNRSTSQVYLLLSTALQEAIDSCECIIFLNTDNSISFNDITAATTRSAWIFDEIRTVNFIQKKTPTRRLQHRTKKDFGKTFAFAKKSEDLNINFNVTEDLNKLSTLSWQDLLLASKKAGSFSSKESALDVLYDTRAIV